MFKTSGKIDQVLDDIVVNYMNKKRIKKINELNSFGYLINLIEDMHRYLNLCLKDLILFDIGIDLASLNFFSGRFFYTNAVEHLFYAYERSFVILGLLFDYPFDSILENNKTFRIEKFVKKVEKYSSLGYKDIYIRLKGNSQLFKELDNVRKYNDHDLSFHSKIIVDDVKEKSNDWNIDGDQADRMIFLPRIKNMIYSFEELYKFIEITINEINKNDYKIINPPMLEMFMKEMPIINISDISYKNFEELDKIKDQWFMKIFSEASLGKRIVQIDEILLDIVFRIAEIIHCFADIINMWSDNFYNTWDGHVRLDGLIDDEYLIQSALFRMYACYDKFARYLSKRNDSYKDIKYFNDINKVKICSTVGNKLQQILNNENYLYLLKYRNDLHHNLRPGALYGDKGIDYYNQTIFIITYRNVKQFMELINDIIMGDKNIGRNSECFCGSGKKYKKCCIDSTSYNT